MDHNYSKAYVEVLEILKYIPIEEKNKIPPSLIQVFKQNADKNYQYQIDTTLDFEKQNLLDETKSILAILFRDYWATISEREQIISKEKLDREQQNKENSKQYRYEDLFKKKQNINSDKKEIIVYEKEKWYHKFLTFIKKFFNK